MLIIIIFALFIASLPCIIPLIAASSGTYTIAGNVFVDTSQSGIRNSGDSGYQGARITLSGVKDYPTNQIALQSKSIQSISQPSYLQQVTDPTYGDLVTRISSQAAFNTSNTELTHDYSTKQVWNADDSLMLLDGWDYDTGYLLDGNGHYLRTLTIPNGNHSARWSNVNPNNLYGIPDHPGQDNSGNQLAVMHPKTDTSTTPAQTVLHTFNEFDSVGANMSFGLEKGNFSNDDTVGAVIGWSTTHSSWGIVTFNMNNTMSASPTVTEIATYWLGSVGGTNNNPDNAGWHAIGVMPKGDGIWVLWNSIGPGINQGVEWMNPTMTVQKHITDNNDHFDVGLDANGNEELVTACGQPGDASTNQCTNVSQANGPPWLAMYGINSTGPTGVNANLYPIGYPNLSESVHISCRNQLLRPGWCYVSDMTNDPSAPIGYEQIYAIKLDSSQTVEVYGADHGSHNTCSNCNQYTARAVPSQDGTRLVFDSDWGAGDTGPSYDYLLQWPQNSTTLTSTTDSSGNYSFSALPAGTYTLTLTVPSGYNATTSTSQTINLSSDTTANFGIVPVASPPSAAPVVLPPTVTPPPSAPMNSVLSLNKLTQSDNTNEVLWSKSSDSLDSWWRGGSGVDTGSVIHISQNDIIGSSSELVGNQHILYTATAHNIWQTSWYPGQSPSSKAILSNVGTIHGIAKTFGPDGTTNELYVLTDTGVSEYWWPSGSTTIRGGPLFALRNPTAMVKALESDGSQVLYLADQNYVYELHWGNGYSGIQLTTITHIVDITSLAFSEDTDGKHRLYVGTSSGNLWELNWYQGGSIGSWYMSGGAPIVALDKWESDATQVLYVATGGSVTECWWSTSSNSLHQDTIASGLGTIHTIDRTTDPHGVQAVYIGAGTTIDEAWWLPGGDGVHVGKVE